MTILTTGHVTILTTGHVTITTGHVTILTTGHVTILITGHVTILRFVLIEGCVKMYREGDPEAVASYTAEMDMPGVSHDCAPCHVAVLMSRDCAHVA